jgi:hypothetical protein
MWNYQGVCKWLEKDSRFNVKVLIIPFIHYSEEERQLNVEGLKDFFNHRGVKYEIPKEDNSWNFEETYHPHIIFYVQTGDNQYVNKSVCVNRNLGKLICYAPYNVFTVCKPFVFDTVADNYAWKQFYMTELFKKEAEFMSRTKGGNVAIVGYPKADRYASKEFVDVWKPQTKKKKRIIFAPHYTIKKGISALNRSAFLSIADDMLHLLDQYKEEAQFCFKPHPLLRTTLYNEPSWGKVRTDEYYSKWANAENGQLETGDYIDLFMTSDAMIHDSASFTAEYHYTGNPILFTTNNPEGIKQSEEMGVLGSKAFDLHYFGATSDRIAWFVNDVVIGGNDPLKEERLKLREEYLFPSNNKSVAENMYNEIVNELFDYNLNNKE